MATMYELTSKYLALLEMADDPETDADALADTLETIEGEIEDKADNVQKILLELDGHAEIIKAEEKRLKERRERLERSAESLKARLKNMMKATGKTKFNTALFSFNIQKNGGSAAVILDVDVDDLPDDLVMIERKPDTKAIQALLKMGDSKYAHFGERGESLRIK